MKIVITKVFVRKKRFIILKNYIFGDFNKLYICIYNFFLIIDLLFIIGIKRD